jgi:hypothetical protein
VHALPRLRVIAASEVGRKEIPLQVVLLSGGPNCEVEERVDHGTLNQWKRATPPNRPFYGARHDRSCIPRGQASERSLTSRRFNDATSEIFLKKRSEMRVVAAVP